MIVTKYPEWIEAQLKIIDERIEEIYRTYMDVKAKPGDAMRIKRDLAEKIRPFVDEKVRLISNSCPTYIVKAESKEELEKLTVFVKSCKNCKNQKFSETYSCVQTPCDACYEASCFEPKEGE